MIAICIDTTLIHKGKMRCLGTDLILGQVYQVTGVVEDYGLDLVTLQELNTPRLIERFLIINNKEIEDYSTYYIT